MTPAKTKIDTGNDGEGIRITYTKKEGVLRISGWFDTCCGISGKTLALGDFLRQLGITADDCATALDDTAQEGPTP